MGILLSKAENDRKGQLIPGYGEVVAKWSVGFFSANVVICRGGRKIQAGVNVGVRCSYS